ncbi:MAG: YgiQ family radical SAM protein, partial [Nitrospinota bacterium]
MQKSAKFLPTAISEAKSRGWDQLDIILITGDAYVDHPSFGAAIVGRFLESLGVRVGIIAAPDINSLDDFSKLGRPEWFFGVTAGNLDSMMMKKTANKKNRSDDAYLPKDSSIQRPTRATIAYCNALKKLFKGTEILIGGVEASLRRFAHYDYWDNKVRRSILFDTRADLLVYGMAENPLNKIIEYAKKGVSLKKMVDIPGTATVLGREDISKENKEALQLPSFEEVSTDKKAYTLSSKLIHLNLNPWSSKTLLQAHGNRFLKVLPPSPPLSEKEMDTIY